MQKYIFPSEYARLVTLFRTNIIKKHTFFGTNQQISTANHRNPKKNTTFAFTSVL